MSGNPPKSSIYTSGVQTLIPILYVAWADRVLSPKEVKWLHKKVEELNFLTEQERTILLNWSNPAKPPSREVFKHWEIELKKAGQQLPENSRKSLVDLGVQMAAQSDLSTDEETVTLSPETLAGLEELETHLGLVHINTYRNIVPAKQPLPVASSFDVTVLNDLLDGKYKKTKQRLLTVLKDPSFKLRTLRNKEDYRLQVLQWCKLLAEQGMGALAYPEAYGGEDDMGKYAMIFETLGYHDLSLTIKFGVQFGLFGGSIAALGTEKHHEKYLADTGTLVLPGCFAMTETGHGSNVRGLETTATYIPERDTLIVNSPNKESGKEYIGNALHGEMASVFCQLIVNGENQGVHAVLVPMRDKSGTLLPGIRVEDCGYKLGLNGVDNGRIWFDQVEVPRDNLLNRFGDIDESGNYHSVINSPAKRFFTMLGTLVGGRVCVPRAGLSATKKGLAIAIKYALKRRQFGPSYTEPETLLLDYPSHQRRLMPLLAKTYAINFALNDLLEQYVSRAEEDMRELETLAAGLKSYATWHTTTTLQECREACGGKGYLAENSFADLKADTDIFTTFEGDNTVLMQLVAKGVLSKFRQEFNEEGMMGVLRFVSGRVSTAFTELNPITIRNTSRDHLLDSDFHRSAFQYRVNQLVYSAGQRLRGHIKSGKSSYDAFLICQTHLLAVAEAYVEQITLDSFLHQIDNCTDINVKTILKQLCDLYALHTIEAHKGWYLEADYMSGTKTKAIRRIVEEYCDTIRQEALGLVEAFGIPSELLNADIVR